MTASAAQTSPVVSSPRGLAQNALAGANVIFSSAVVYTTNIVPDGKTVKQEFSEFVTGIKSGDLETGVRAVLKYGRGQTANVATMGIGAVSAYAKGGIGTFGAVLGGGLIGGFAGAYVGTWGGDWLAKNKFHWDKTDINSNKPVCKGDMISHQRKNIGLWGLAIGVLAGAAVLFFGAMTFGFGLLAGFVASSIIAAAHAMSQYGEVKGEILEGSPNVTFEGRAVARMGDRVKCDDHSHEEFIAEGVKTVTVNGRLLAKVGCRTTCDGNLDRKTETTIGVDKATATDPEHYPIRESTSLLAEFAATASIYIPWHKVFGKVKGWFGKGNLEPSIQQYVDAGIDLESAQRLNKWKYPPDPDLYLKNKTIYDNPKYYDQSSGDIHWPLDDGFVSGTQHIERLTPGTKLSRYGEHSGDFLGAVDDSFPSRSLAPHSQKASYYEFEVLREADFTVGKIAPWFDQPGGGTQYIMIDGNGNKYSVQRLIDDAFIRELP